jgi:hypothetical protein
MSGMESTFKRIANLISGGKSPTEAMDKTYDSEDEDEKLKAKQEEDRRKKADMFKKGFKSVY